ncbi:MAG: PLP-dependent aminotransferase family protein [Bacteroidales bacterium]|nr:PLP-dependent aminotransferase family protein [Bacteroidales bacterium]
MDYRHLFSSDVPSFMRSPVREIFRKVDLSAICSFAGGYPAAVTFPVEDLRKLPGLVLDKYGTKSLQYGATQGVPELRETIAKRYGVPVSQVQITTSSQQGIDVCTRILCDPGDIVLTTEPTYLGALQSFKAYRADVRPIKSIMGDREGIVPETVVSDDPSQTSLGPSRFPGGSLTPYGPQGDICPSGCGRGWPQVSGTTPSRPDSKPVKFIYVIPDFNNPSGETMTLEERKEIVALARELDIVIVEDSPYREIRYTGEDVPMIRELAPERTLHLGSFSKIFAPGFRLGWIIGPEELLEQIYICKQALDLCPPVFDQYMATEFLTSGALDANLVKTKAEYRRRRDLMVSLLEKYMPEGVKWTYPEGGLFLFLTLPEGIDTIEMYDEALSKGVAYVAGSFFFLDGSHRNTMRLNFSFVAEEKMEPGMKLLGEIIKERL